MRPFSETPSEQTIESESLLQLLLFVDKRLTAEELIRSIQNYLNTLRSDCNFDLQVIDVGEQPYLAEHFKLVATPTLIKIHPEPRHTLAGTNLVAQLVACWPLWQKSVEDHAAAVRYQLQEDSAKHTIAQAAELMQVTDELFRLKQEKEALQDQLRFKERVIAMLAHDLRNPLTAALIALETLETLRKDQEQLTPEMLARLTRHARTQMQRIDRMITSLLQTSRNKNAALHIHPKRLDLRVLCFEVLENLKGYFESKTQQIQVDIPHDLPDVYADADLVRQVMSNLLENASKYTPDAGVIQTSILHRTVQKVQVSICDNGLGIPLENQECIFEDEFRLQRDKNEKGYGIGLGLCRQIIRAHYGQIWVDSKPNQGSNFHFTLPVYRA